MEIPRKRKLVEIKTAGALANVSRRTIYNWINQDKIEYVRTAGGQVRIFVDTLFKDGKQPQT